MSASRILLVEDDDIVAGFIEYLLTDHGLQVVRTADAEAGWAELERTGGGFGAILLDRQLPGMDGMALLGKIKEHPSLRDIPVIMETSEDSIESIREGLAAGAYYYLTKPMQPELLLAVVDAALAQYRQWVESQAGVHEAESALLSLEYGVFRCRTLAESRDLASGLARGCPDPKRVVLGLQELLTNAVEHGNLGISYADKTRLVLENRWADEVERRLAQPGWGRRTVTVTLSREAGDITLTIQDEGDGFDWRKYLEFDPERAFDPHGRGIAMARMMSFDALDYQGNGNTVVVKIAGPAQAAGASQD
jgi:DNA-binding response OmpR family regulator